ncbi:MAG: hypothetical protein AAF549_04160 [Pseudomonadota bacterium]
MEFLLSDLTWAIIGVGIALLSFLWAVKKEKKNKENQILKDALLKQQHEIEMLKLENLSLQKYKKFYKESEEFLNMHGYTQHGNAIKRL